MKNITVLALLLFPVLIQAQILPNQTSQKDPEGTDAIYTQENGTLNKILFDSAFHFFIPRIKTAALSYSITSTDNPDSLRGYFVLDNTATWYYIDSASAAVSLGGGGGGGTTQLLSYSGTDLSISGGNTVSLSNLLDNTDTQLTEAEVDAYVADNGYLTSYTETDPVWTADKPNYATTAYVDANDDTGTDDQTASEVSVTPTGNLESTNVQDALEEIQTQVDGLGGGGTADGVATAGTYNAGTESIDVTVASPGSNFSIDVSALLDNTNLTEAEVDAFVDNNGYLTSEIDGSVTNEIQDLQSVTDEGATTTNPVILAGGVTSGANGGTNGFIKLQSNIGPSATLSAVGSGLRINPDPGGGPTGVVSINRQADKNPTTFILEDATSILMEYEDSGTSGDIVIESGPLTNGSTLTLGANASGPRIVMGRYGLVGNPANLRFNVFNTSTEVEDTKMILTTNGRLGIGTTTPTTLLDVNGTASISGALTLGSVTQDDTETNLLVLQSDGEVQYRDVSTISAGTDDQTAAEVPVTPTGNLNSTDVQAALEEHQADIDAITGGGGVADGVITGASYNAGTEQIDVTVNAPGSSFSFNVSALLDNTDAQDLSLDGTTLSLTGDATPVDLSVVQDGTGTDDQVIDVFSITGNTLSLSIEDDGEATKTVDLSGLTASPNFDYIQLNTAFDNQDFSVGEMGWDETGSFRFGVLDNYSFAVGQDMYKEVHNTTASLIPQGTALMMTGADGASNVFTVAPMNYPTIGSEFLIGIAANDIAAGGFGVAVQNGYVKGIDVNGEGWSEGDVLYLDETSAGGLTTTVGNVLVAAVTKAGSNGTIYVRPDFYARNEIQTLSLGANTLSLTDGGSVDLSGYLDDTNLTEAEVDAFVANNGYLTSYTETDPIWTAEKSDYATIAYVDANSGGLTWGDQSIYNNVSATTLDFATYAAANSDIRNFNFGLTATPLSADPDVILNLPADATGYEEYIITVTCDDNGANACIVNNLVDGNYTMVDGELLIVKAATKDAGVVWYYTSSLGSGLPDPQVLSWTAGTNGNDVITLSNGGGSITITDNVNDADADPTNEIQSILLGEDNLLLISGSPSSNSADLSRYLDNTDEQDLSLSGNTLSLTGDATSVDLSGYLDNTDSQTLGVSGDDITLTNGGSVSVINTVNPEIAGNVTVAIDLESARNRVVQIDMTSATSTFEVGVSNPVSGGVYTFHFQNTSNHDINFPTNFLKADGTTWDGGSTVNYSADDWLTCYYDGANFYCK